MAHPPETKSRVRQAYVFDRLGLEAAAGKAGVSLAAARRWKAAAEAAGDDWERARAAASLSTAGAGAIAQIVLQDFLTLHSAVVEDIRHAQDATALDKAEALSRLADAFAKTMSAVAKAAPDLGRYAVASELLQDLARFVAERHPEHAPAVAAVLEPFARFVAERYGG